MYEGYISLPESPKLKGMCKVEYKTLYTREKNAIQLKVSYSHDVFPCAKRCCTV